MKKKYLRPTIQVVILQQQGIICTSNVESVNSNADIHYGGGGSGPAYAPRHKDIDWNDWDDWEQ